MTIKIRNIPEQFVFRLGQFLRTNGYNQKNAEKHLQYRFGSWLTAFAPTFLFPLFNSKLSINSPLELLLLFFYCCSLVPVASLKKIIGSKLFEDGCQWGLFGVFGGMVECKIQIIPFNDLVIATERPKKEKSIQCLSFDYDTVMTLFPDSYDLAKYIKFKKARNALDLFCGNGVQALLLAKNADRVMGVDANIKAIDFARFNAQLNNVRNVKFEYCDLNKSMKHFGCFDLIVANPPFCPSFKKNTMFCDGGTFGDYFVSLLLNKRLIEIANNDATVVTIFTMVLKEGETTKDRIESYLNDRLRCKIKIKIIDINDKGPVQDSLCGFLIYYLSSRYIGSLENYAPELTDYYKNLKSLNVVGATYNILELSKVNVKRDI